LTTNAKRTALILAMLWSAYDVASAEESGQCKTLTRQQIGAIVDQELKRRFGSADRAQHVKIDIWRKDCDYYYFEDEVPWSPGAGFGFKIDDSGKVLEFIPAL
jgi:hypothetical protein